MMAAVLACSGTQNYTGSGAPALIGPARFAAVATAAAVRTQFVADARCCTQTAIGCTGHRPRTMKIGAKVSTVATKIQMKLKPAAKCGSFKNFISAPRCLGNAPHVEVWLAPRLTISTSVCRRLI